MIAIRAVKLRFDMMASDNVERDVLIVTMHLSVNIRCHGGAHASSEILPVPWQHFGDREASLTTERTKNSRLPPSGILDSRAGVL